MGKRVGEILSFGLSLYLFFFFFFLFSLSSRSCFLLRDPIIPRPVKSEIWRKRV